MVVQSVKYSQNHNLTSTVVGVDMKITFPTPPLPPNKNQLYCSGAQDKQLLATPKYDMISNNKRNNNIRESSCLGEMQNF